YSYNLLKQYKDNFDTIIILGVNHRSPGFYKNSVYAGDAYQTPLGNMSINQTIVKRLLAYDDIVFEEKVHRNEHSLEVQIPFLQEIKNFQIVPLIVGNYSLSNCQRLADILLKEVVNKEEKVLFLSSTDFSHFYPYEIANRMDQRAIRQILKLDITSFASLHSNKKIELCGYGPVLVPMMLAKKLGYEDTALLKYANSGDTAGSKKKVVGYGAIAFYQGKHERHLNPKKKEEKKMEEKENYTKEEKEFLLKVARQTVETYVKERTIPQFKTDNPKFSEYRGAFVTLHKQGSLRGCIGYIEPIKPLLKTVVENAVNACSKDTRFNKVSEAELKNIDIEISILSVPEKIKSHEEIVIGKHGVILEKGFYRSVFLPQVAPEQGWDVKETLDNLSYKAGLPPSGWKEGATFSTFTADVFGEKKA
ncbi:AmmeMemoRadiSam system protein B, partial [Candidatus Auribacterota bacterium]